MMHRTRCCAAIAAAPFIAAFIAGCGSGAGAPPVVMPATNPVLKASATSSPTPLVSQNPDGARLAQNDAQLDRGMLTYTPVKSVRSGKSVEFHITVTDVGHGAELTSVPTMYHDQAVDPYDVPAAAEVSVQIICADGLSCQSQTAQLSQFVDPGHQGSWTWRVTGQTPGPAMIGIIAASYERGGAAFLHATPLWTVALTVQAAA
jgi:uncharacterized cupredoxin-like copper-binding protein